mmetsp:Transcript_6350/g.17872  ORF Transcript_6350/g.17872 Transcript_6350/m.17872 type:complete len:1366 (-) Transcript_6350:515-4612(-)
MFAAGSRVHFYDVNTDEQTYLRTLSGQAVGAVAVHPSMQYICVAETGTNPLCCVYAYPSRKLYRVLRGGTERAFSAASFDHAGGKLATVGSFPDYMLTVWDWKSESIVLRSKAFSQEVFRVTFSPYVDGSLITSGTGHIRFWRMASTFTGLKLQGDIGKFGTVELTDIRGYVELPSGKVLSGSDWGNFLLWNGNLIECEVCREGGAKCHDGAVNFLNIEEDRIISAGDDGRLIQWDLKAVEAAEVTEENPLFQLTPMAEMSLAGKEPGREHARLQTLTKAPDGQWLVQDEAGALYKVDLSTQIAMTVKRFHSGAITGVDTSPKAHLAATCGADGSVRVWNYLKRELVVTQRFGVGATCLTWASLAVDLDARTLAVGFSDGTLRVLQVCSDGLELVAALKPHAARVTHVLYSPNGKQIVTSADDGTVFFVDVVASYAPLGYMQLPSAVVSASWKSDSTALLVGYGHELVALDTPQPGAFDSSQSFLLALAATPLGLDDVRAVILSRLQAEREALREVAKAKYLEKHPQPTDDPELAAEMEAARLEVEAEEESARGPVVAPPVVARSLLAQEDGSLLVAVDSGSESLGVWSLREPGEAPEQLREGTPLTCWLGTSCSKRYVTSAGVDGSVTLAPQMAAPYWEGHLHEALRLDEAGAITARLSFDDGYLVSASTDGTFFVLGVAEVEPDKSAPGIDLMPSRTGDLVADVSATAYSLEEAKQKEESDARAAAADRAKMTVRERIADLRKRFDGLRAKNEAASDADRLPKDQFAVDPGLRERIQRETEDRLTEARRELAWDSEAGAVALHKLESKYIEPLEVEDIVLYGFANRKSARSIRTSKLTPWQCEAIDAVHELINAELTSRGAGDGAARAAAGSDGANEGDNGAEQGTTATEGGDAGEASQDGALNDVKISKAEQRAMRRAARAKAWASFMARKPAEGFSDPADIAAIEVAKATLGFFSLKTDPDYVVPEALRVNAQKKRRQLVLLDESVHALKMAYNERFLALRNLKRRMIDAMSAEHERLSTIEAELGIEPRSAPPPSTLAPEEEPELRSRVTEADLAAHAVASAKGASGSFGGFGGGSSASPGAKLTTSSSHFEAPAAGAPSRHAQSAVRDSPLVAAERALARAKLEFERRGFLERRSRSIASFDSALEELRIERFRLLADLKSAELRRILLFRELQLLKEFEKRDNALASKLAKAHTDKAEVAARVADCQEKLNAKKVEMEKMLEADRAIMEEFTTTVGERHKAFDALLKIFRRKIKRTRKPVQNDDAEDPDHFDSEDESEDDDDDDDDEEEEEEEEEDEFEEDLEEDVPDRYQVKKMAFAVVDKQAKKNKKKKKKGGGDETASPNRLNSMATSKAMASLA